MLDANVDTDMPVRRAKEQRTELGRSNKRSDGCTTIARNAERGSCAIMRM